MRAMLEEWRTYYYCTVNKKDLLGTATEGLREKSGKSP